MKQRLDKELVLRKLAPTRSQAESYIKLGQVKVNGVISKKPSSLVGRGDKLHLVADHHYVSRAGLKLGSVANSLELTFRDKLVLDIGSSTGGFTDFALQNGAKHVVAVDVGTNQMHASLRHNPRVELHEQTDIRDFVKYRDKKLSQPDIIVIDVSFISLEKILPSVSKLAGKHTNIVAMAKPQFEAGSATLKHKGVIKNDKMRREVLKNLETWMRKYFVLVGKADSGVSGDKGNLERFYLLKKL